MRTLTPHAKFLPGIACLLGLPFLAGCGPRTSPLRAPLPAAHVAASLSSPAASDDPLPLHVSRARLTELILTGLEKPVMGRRESLRDVARVATEDGPLVVAAARQPAVQGELAQLARDQGIPLKTARARWVAWQEADLLLESGGDPEAVSPAGAVGVAQWMAGTGTHGTLAINAPASRRLTKQVDALKRQVAWDEYLQRPDADLAAPGTPALSRAQAAAQLPGLRTRLEALRAQRRRVDARYDPRPAIFAQTRYLLGLYPRFPSPDWLFQAYHGGEAGVARSLQRYLGPAWPGSTAAAIRSGNGGHRMRFEDVYLGTTPRAHPAAFAYLYGRGDDHRHYWWKLRAAQAALALYRRDPAAFRREWAANLPGRATEAVWYPDGPAGALADLPGLRAASQGRRLRPVTSGPLYAVRPAPLDAPNARWYAALRPEAKGALLLVATLYRRAGGAGRLTAGDLTLTQAYVTKAAALFPPPAPKGPLMPPDPAAHTLPGGGPPADFDYHTTGLAFDLLRPAPSRSRKTLEYALGWAKDRQILWWREEADRSGRRYHVVPNPRYATALTSIGTTSVVPPT